MVCEVAEYLILSILLIRFLMEKDVFLLFSLSLSLSLIFFVVADALDAG